MRKERHMGGRKAEASGKSVSIVDVSIKTEAQTRCLLESALQRCVRHWGTRGRSAFACFTDRLHTTGTNDP